MPPAALRGARRLPATRCQLIWGVCRSPLIKMKTSLTRLRAEIKQLDIRIGVVTHTLVQKKVKQNIATREEAAAPKNAHIQQQSYLDEEMLDE